MSGSAEMELVSRGRLKPRTLALSTIGIAGYAAVIGQVVLIAFVAAFTSRTTVHRTLETIQ